MRTLEDNKIIAEFMGWVHSVKAHHGINLFHFPDGDKPPLQCDQQSLEGFKYDTSWDSLKPVIDKIIKTIGVKSIDECSDEEWFQHTRIARMYIGIDIIHAHYYVVEWIMWYNKNKN